MNHIDEHVEKLKTLLVERFKIEKNQSINRTKKNLSWITIHYLLMRCAYKHYFWIPSLMQSRNNAKISFHAGFYAVKWTFVAEFMQLRGVVNYRKGLDLICNRQVLARYENNSSSHLV